MRIQIRFNDTTNAIELEDDATVQQLMDKVHESLEVEPEKQKFIFRGKVLSSPEDALSKLGITNNAKLLLTVQASQPATTAHPQGPAKARCNQAAREFLTTAPHSAIISKGPPPNCGKPYHSQMTVLPKSPFVVYNTEGVVSKLSFESDAVWIESEDGAKERIFFTDIRSNVVQEIPRYEKDYVALCLVTAHGKRWFYFIPGQYSQILPKVISVP